MIPMKVSMLFWRLLAIYIPTKIYLFKRDVLERDPKRGVFSKGKVENICIFNIYFS